MNLVKGFYVDCSKTGIKSKKKKKKKKRKKKRKKEKEKNEIKKKNQIIIFLKHILSIIKICQQLSIHI